MLAIYKLPMQYSLKKLTLKRLPIFYIFADDAGC